MIKISHWMIVCLALCVWSCLSEPVQDLRNDVPKQLMEKLFDDFSEYDETIKRWQVKNFLCDSNRSLPVCAADVRTLDYLDSIGVPLIDSLSLDSNIVSISYHIDRGQYSTGFSSGGIALSGDISVMDVPVFFHINDEENEIRLGSVEIGQQKQEVRVGEFRFRKENGIGETLRVDIEAVIR